MVRFGHESHGHNPNVLTMPPYLEYKVVFSENVRAVLFSSQMYFGRR